VLAFSGCDKGSDETATDNSTKTTDTEDENTTGAGWTSVQAAEVAYAKITEEWNAKAVLWALSPTRLDAQWQSNDRAEWWTVIFVTPDNNETRLVYLGGPLDNTIDNVGNTRDLEIKSTYPKDKPKYSMQEAYQTTVENGGPTDVMADAVDYDIDSWDYPGQPIWKFVYRFDTSAGEEIHFYYVDGLTNKFLQAAYKRDGDLIDKSESQAEY
jgi:hypothetical protein